MSPAKRTILDLVNRATERLKMHTEKVLELTSLGLGEALLQFTEIAFRLGINGKYPETVSLRN